MQVIALNLFISRHRVRRSSGRHNKSDSTTDTVTAPVVSRAGSWAILTFCCSRASLIDAPAFAVTSMADDQRDHLANDSDSKYQAFDVGGPKGEPRDEPKKRSTLLTVCPFILGEPSRN